MARETPPQKITFFRNYENEDTNEFAAWLDALKIPHETIPIEHGCWDMFCLHYNESLGGTDTYKGNFEIESCILQLRSLRQELRKNGN